jgi:hypothetical protein
MHLTNHDPNGPRRPFPGIIGRSRSSALPGRHSSPCGFAPELLGTPPPAPVPTLPASRAPLAPRSLPGPHAQPHVPTPADLFAARPVPLARKNGHNSQGNVARIRLTRGRGGAKILFTHGEVCSAIPGKTGSTSSSRAVAPRRMLRRGSVWSSADTSRGRRGLRRRAAPVAARPVPVSKAFDALAITTAMPEQLEGEVWFGGVYLPHLRGLLV